MGITIKTSGWIFKNPDKFEQAVKAAVAKTTPQLPKLPQSRSPVRTGRLFASWRSENLGKGIKVLSDGVAYAVYVEFGTSKMSAQPMLAPSIEQMRTVLANNISSEISSLM